MALNHTLKFRVEPSAYDPAGVVQMVEIGVTTFADSTGPEAFKDLPLLPDELRPFVYRSIS
jgi:hypothetical protein